MSTASRQGHGRLVPEDALIEAMRRLPTELVGALRRAVEAADDGLILALTEQVSTQEAALGSQLRALARDFDYSTLHRLLAENGRSQRSPSQQN